MGLGFRDLCSGGVASIRLLKGLFGETRGMPGLGKAYAGETTRFRSSLEMIECFCFVCWSWYCPEWPLYQYF